MSPVQASCPACGGPITFKMGSAIVAVCEYCHSVVARGDRHLEDLGKVADLVDTGSPLDVGLKGRYHGAPFELTGRAQLGHPAGGIWDEWYAAFADGRWGWLAEAQGRFYMTFRHESPHPEKLPAFDALIVGQPAHLTAGSIPLVVAEKAKARAVSAKGEIPYRLVPGFLYDYADLSGPAGQFATLDYSEPVPLVFVGQQITLDDLHIPEMAALAGHELRKIEAIQLSCPRCGGALELRAPDQSERVTCPNCASLLDIHEGQLKFFTALQPSRLKPIIPLGTVATFKEHPFTAIGFMQRSVTVEEVKYFWEEYLLYHPREGFRWLVRSENQWSFVEPLAAGDVFTRGNAKKFRDNDFKIFQKNIASVEYVIGEFYWKVTVGEKARVADYIHPPQMLSSEISEIQGGSEVNWSLGTFIRPDEVEKACGIRALPRPALTNVAPNQPFLYGKIFLHWVYLGMACMLLGCLIIAMSSHRVVYEQNLHLQPTGPAMPAEIIFTPPFELKSHKNIRVSANASVDNSWIDIEGDFINEQTGIIQPFSLPVEYYHGYEGGESWSEGSQHSSVYLSALPAGTYSLRLEFQRDKSTFPAAVAVKVEQGVPHVVPWFLTLLAVSIIPMCVLIYYFMFESWRWKDSEFSPYHSKKK